MKDRRLGWVVFVGVGVRVVVVDMRGLVVVGMVVVVAVGCVLVVVAVVAVGVGGVVEVGADNKGGVGLWVVVRGGVVRAECAGEI